MTVSLFRKEALAARQTRWLGSITLHQAPGPWLSTAVAVFAAAAVVLLLAFGEYTRRSRVVGQLVPSRGIASVTAPVAGTLVQVRVVEGQSVRAGEVLAVLAMPRATLGSGDTGQALQARLAEQQASVVAAFASQRRQLQAQAAGLDAQDRDLAAERGLAEAELDTRRQQHRLAAQALARLRRLREQQYVTELQLQQQASGVLEQLAAVQSLERTVRSLRRQQAQLQQARAELPHRLAALEAGEQRERAGLSLASVETRARTESVIVAPVDGTVGTLLGQVGQALQAGQPVLGLLPAGSRLEAHLLVPSRAAGFIAADDAVLLRYQAFPYQAFGHHGGRVLRISRSAIPPGELASMPGMPRPGEPYYRIVVELAETSVRAFGKNEPLKPGMLVEADILGETRRLWAWAMAPLSAMAGPLAGPPDADRGGEADR
ncbi:MAG TPA: HlyD family efflux transporter periplasmic adaptor subunit [Arenimonas sp.]|uniref:HlyD family secretion protein n=1 Tax=Arenimonas sp. TaxID=1872635 RepID=UPI002D7EF8D8|nr:HlyD family efflux transporter periplasmic adaptor subunit [Arenimonas sp.]HEU0154176.1 HlyD family efflux transporter periplasmic adaptor subunit [Arenimonas sp.]